MMLWYFILFPMEIIFKHIPSVSSLNIAVLQFKVRKPESNRLKTNSFLKRGQKIIFLKKGRTWIVALLPLLTNG